MISNIYPEMNFAYQNSLYQHGTSVPSGVKHNNTIMGNNLNSYNSSLLPVRTHYQQPTISSSVQSNDQQHYPPQQTWKQVVGSSNNELILSHEVIIPSSMPYFQRNVYESSLPVDSSYRLQHLNNNLYSAVNHDNPYFSSSSSTLSLSPTPSNLMYSNQKGNTNIGSNDYNHYRRSSMNTSRSSSPSTSSYATSYHDYHTLNRSPSPGNSKRYSCGLCHKRFTRPSSLTTHIYSHTGEKPFKCTFDGCGRNFSVVSNLRRHAKIHNNNNPSSSTSSSTTHSY